MLQTGPDDTALSMSCAESGALVQFMSDSRSGTIFSETLAPRPGSCYPRGLGGALERRMTEIDWKAGRTALGRVFRTLCEPIMWQDPGPRGAGRRRCGCASPEHLRLTAFRNRRGADVG
ncbi:hypothetical protein [Actinomadura violacea]|uniref:Uncharacterized protein n=1 Tax=Actinomadura violacea TaxID=2819934 RepID=A0ABS3S3L8_9ACTN|nr:hypothetical protein [Actinomadura violacea]MBO2463590.1 hypothetical protein [Actinomadura violacea]